MVGNTFIRVSYQGTIYDLDVLEQTPIRMDISSIENDRIGDVFGAASQTFTLPSTRTNNKFFNHAYKIGSITRPAFTNSVDCWVISDSDTLLEGSMFLDEIIKLEDGSYNYNVTITNNVISFNELIKIVPIRDLDWDEYDHNPTVENITGSWNNNLFSGDIFYPLVDFGQDGIEPTSSVPFVDVSPDGNIGYFNNSTSPLQVQQFSPAVRVSTVLDKIFDYGGFQYSSSLQGLFDELYVLPRQSEILAIQGAGFGDFGFVAAGSISSYAVGTYTASFGSEIYDPTNSYNTTTSVFTIPRAGSYVLNTLINFVFQTPTVDNGSVQVNIRRNNSIIAQQTEFFNGTYSGTQTISVSTSNIEGSYIFLNVGDNIRVELIYTATPPNNPQLTIINTSRFQTLLTPINYTTGTVKMGLQFDPQTKAIDFLKGLIEKFNLVIEPVYTENKTLKIETYETWISSGEQYDWTEKIDNAKRVSIKSPLSSQQKTLIFEDQSDNDKWSKITIENAEGYQWGTEQVDAVSNVPQGEKKIGSYFAPIVLEGMGGSSNTNLIPKLYKFEKDVNKTFKHKPRLGYKLYPRELGTTGYINSNTQTFTQYATISNYDSLPVSVGTTNNLHYNESFYLPLFGTTTNLQTGSITAYDRYWSGYINDLYNDETIILNAELYFEPTDINKIALNNKIFVNDNWYRINKIQGFNLNAPDVVNVELISLPRAPELNLCEFDFSSSFEGYVSASGGEVITFTSGGLQYRSHTFTSFEQPLTASFQVHSGSLTDATIMVIGGGGGAGGVIIHADGSNTFGGAGGAGQVIYSSSLTLPSGSYVVNSGLYGDWGGLGVSASGDDGDPSRFIGNGYNITAYGGGGGGMRLQNGRNGGSGGGSGWNSTAGSGIYGPLGNNGASAALSCGGSNLTGGAGGGAMSTGSGLIGGTPFVTTIRTGNREDYAGGGYSNTVSCGTTLPSGSMFYGSGGSNRGGTSPIGFNYAGFNAFPGIVTITYKL